MTDLVIYVYCPVPGCRARMACQWRHLDNLRATYRCTDHREEGGRPVTTYSDWRTGPDPLKCISCHATESACDNKRCFAGRSCCDDCDHQAAQAADKSGTVTGSTSTSEPEEVA